MPGVHSAGLPVVGSAPSGGPRAIPSFGGYGEYVERSEEVAPAVERALRSGCPSLVKVVVRSGASPFAEAMISRRTGR